MKRVRSGLFAVLASSMVVAALSAQTPPPPSADQPTARAKAADDKVTVTGCLERAKETASATATGTAGSAAASASTNKFVLNNVTSSPSATGTAGASATTASSYRLDGDDSKLTPHVGHKVEITGTVAKEASATGATMGASAPRLKVEDVKMLDKACTP
jgi:hypothetical protein